MKKSGPTGVLEAVEEDQLGRLRACLAATVPLVQGIRVSELGAGDPQAVHDLDVRAFEIAVEGSLFFEAVGQIALSECDRIHPLAGPALEATTMLRRSAEESARSLSASEENRGDVLAALSNLSGTLEKIGSRLESLCRSLIMTELCSMTLALRRKKGHDATERGRTRTGARSPL